MNTNQSLRRLPISASRTAGFRATRRATPSSRSSARTCPAATVPFNEEWYNVPVNFEVGKVVRKGGKKSVCKLRREGRMHLGGSQSRSSARAFIFPQTTGNILPRRAWRRSAVIARISSALVSRLRHRQTTAGKRRCEATPYSSPNMPAPAVAAAAWRSGGKFRRERPSRPRDKRELLTF